MRRDPFVENEYYHIYNRGVDKRDVFLDEKDFKRFLLAMRLLNHKQDGLMIRWRDHKKTYPQNSLQNFLTLNVRKKERLVEILAYCLNPNHYHLLLKQAGENDGIKIFMQRLGNSYTKYFNEKNERSGVLFQGRFKSARIKSTSQLLRMSVYVNSNCEIHGLAKAESYRWCGFSEYLRSINGGLCDKSVIMSHFNANNNYENYARENILDFKRIKEDEKSFLLE